MRPRLLSLIFLFAAAFSPFYASAQGSFLDSIVPQSGICTCEQVPVQGTDPSLEQVAKSAPSWGCMLLVVQNTITVAISIATLFIVLALMYAGFLLMTSGGSPEKRTQARRVVTNAVIGLLVMLGAWLIIDFVMKAVYDPNAAFSGQKLGPWNAIWSAKEDSMCLVVSAPVPLTTGIVAIVLPSSSSGGGSIGVAGEMCADSNPACSVAALRAQGLSAAQARAMSCIAVTESSGNPNTPNSSTGACGTWQITNRTSRSNWQNPIHHGPGCSVSTSCNNARCNMQTAVIMFNKYGYQPWTGKNPNGTHWNPNAVACVAKHDPGH